MRLVKKIEAARKIGRHRNIFSPSYGSKELKKFVHGNMVDIDGLLRYVKQQEELRELKYQVLIKAQELKEQKKIKYSEMARIIGVTPVAFANGTFSAHKAKKFLEYYRKEL